MYLHSEKEVMGASASTSSTPQKQHVPPVLLSHAKGPLQKDIEPKSQEISDVLKKFLNTDFDVVKGPNNTTLLELRVESWIQVPQALAKIHAGKQDVDVKIVFPELDRDGKPYPKGVLDEQKAIHEFLSHAHKKSPSQLSHGIAERIAGCYEFKKALAGNKEYQPVKDKEKEKETTDKIIKDFVAPWFEQVDFDKQDENVLRVSHIYDAETVVKQWERKAKDGDLKNAQLPGYIVSQIRNHSASGDVIVQINSNVQSLPNLLAFAEAIGALDKETGNSTKFWVNPSAPIGTSAPEPVELTCEDFLKKYKKVVPTPNTPPKKDEDKKDSDTPKADDSTKAAKNPDKDTTPTGDSPAPIAAPVAAPVASPVATNGSSTSSTSDGAATGGNGAVSSAANDATLGDKGGDKGDSKDTTPTPEDGKKKGGISSTLNRVKEASVKGFDRAGLAVDSKIASVASWVLGTGKKTTASPIVAPTSQSIEAQSETPVATPSESTSHNRGTITLEELEEAGGTSALATPNEVENTTSAETTPADDTSTNLDLSSLFDEDEKAADALVAEVSNEKDLDKNAPSTVDGQFEELNTLNTPPATLPEEESEVTSPSENVIASNELVAAGTEVATNNLVTESDFTSETVLSTPPTVLPEALGSGEELAIGFTEVPSVESPLTPVQEEPTENTAITQEVEGSGLPDLIFQVVDTPPSDANENESNGSDSEESGKDGEGSEKLS